MSYKKIFGLFLLFLSFSQFAFAVQSDIEQTLSIIKPNAVQNNNIGEIVARFEKNGLRIAAMKMVMLSQEQAKGFYAEHAERPFYKDLVSFMTSGPVVVMVLQGKDAVSQNRKIMGATDPTKAEKGTIRADFATSMTANAVHGSDSASSARREIRFFFPPDEVYNRF